MRTLTIAIANLDSQDPGNVGMAYHLHFDDGHEESGALDTTDPTDIGAITSEIQAMVTAYDGPELGRPEYHDGDGESYVWRLEGA